MIRAPAYCEVGSSPRWSPGPQIASGHTSAHGEATITQCLYSPAFNKNSRSLEEFGLRKEKDNPGPQQNTGQAIQIVDYIKTTIQDDPLRRKEIGPRLSTDQDPFLGAGGEPVSRKRPSEPWGERKPFACLELCHRPMMAARPWGLLQRSKSWRKHQ